MTTNIHTVPSQYPGLQLTPAGIAAKGRTTTRFLARKQAEYGRPAVEIEQLRREAQAIGNES